MKKGKPILVIMLTLVSLYLFAWLNMENDRRKLRKKRKQIKNNH